MSEIVEVSDEALEKLVEKEALAEFIKIKREIEEEVRKLKSAWFMSTSISNIEYETKVAELWRAYRWGDIVRCPYCGSVDVKQYGYQTRKGYTIPVKFYLCKRCGRKFSDFSGTPFYKTILTPGQITSIAELYDMGFPTRLVAEWLGVSKTVIVRAYKIFRENPDLLAVFLAIVEEVWK